jgi:transposase InsO family protein
MVLAGTHPDWDALPAPSTITAILARHHRLDPLAAAKHRPYKRFVAAEPNDLWQMDFKGDFALADGRCYPLTILDDHAAPRCWLPPVPISRRRRCRRT